MRTRRPRIRGSRRAGALLAAWAIAVPVAAQALPDSGDHGAPSQERGLEILDRAAARYQGVETVCADFTQELSNPLLRTSRSGSGQLCQSRPNLFAMRFEDPAGDLIVVDGRHAWVYFPSNDAKTVLKTDAGESAGGRDFHREFLVDPGSKYTISYEGMEILDGRSTHRLVLTPKRPASYRTATLWIDEGRPVLRRLRLREENGNERVITLEGVEFGADPDDDYFSFQPPEGALVVRR